MRTIVTSVARHLFGIGVPAAIAFPFVLAPIALNAQQNDVSIIVNHGGPNESRTMEYVLDPNTGRILARVKKLNLVRRPGSELCVDVENANPVFFTYSFENKREAPVQQFRFDDGTLTALKDFFGREDRATFAVDSSGDEQTLYVSSDAPVVTISKSAPPQAPNNRSKPKTIGDLYPQLVNAVTQLAYLEGDLRKAQTAIAHSAEPEPLLFDGRAAGLATKGFIAAKDTLRALDAGPGRFNDPNAEKTIKDLLDGAQQSTSGSESTKALGQILVAALRSHAQTLLTARSAYRSYLAAPSIVTLCKAIENKEMTINLNAIPRNPSIQQVRDTGTILTIHVTPEFVRPALEFVPIAFGVYAKNVPQFAVRGGVIAEDHDEEFKFRGGTMIVANVKELTQDKSVALGLGLGVGVGGSKTISDFLVGGTISYRDVFRAGIGWGRAQLPQRLSSKAKLGQPLPSDVGNIDDVVESSGRSAYYLIFNLTGVKLTVLDKWPWQAPDSTIAALRE